MRFLIDADLPRSAKPLLVRYGHEATDVRDVGLGHVPDTDVARYAQRETPCLLTGDYDFANIRRYPPHQYQGIVALAIAPSMTAPSILALLEEFLKQQQLVRAVTGKLTIVEPGRIRIRAA